jgi:hypothetical protein
LSTITVQANLNLASSAFPRGFNEYYERTALRRGGTYYWWGGTAWGSDDGPALLTPGPNVYITKIDGEYWAVRPGESVTLPAGRHIIEQYYSGSDGRSVRDDDPWRIYLNAGKRHIIAARKEGNEIIFSINEQ